MIKKDVVVIGASAAGISAGIYLARHKFDFVILSENIGGEVITSGEVNNYPGFLQTTGAELATKLEEHINFYGDYIVSPLTVTKIEKNSEGFTVFGDEENYLCKSVIFATGGHPRKLNIEGEEQFSGKGISYCTVCDGPIFKDKSVAVIGGGNTANESAIMLSEIANKVYLLTVNENMCGDEMLIKKIKSLSNVQIITKANVKRFLGEVFLEKLEYEREGDRYELNIKGAFVNIGWTPNSSSAPVNIEKDEKNYIKINSLCNTSLSGFFAAGDVTDISHNQIGIAVGHGIICALEAINYVNKNTRN